MICLLHLPWNARPGLSYLASASGRREAGRLVVMDYQALRRLPNLPRALYLLGDVEVLKQERPLVEAVHARLLNEVGPALVWNCPHTTHSRYPLLRRLEAEGINTFSIYRLDTEERPRQYPVFVRQEQDHAGSRTQLIPDSTALEQEVTRLRAQPGGLWGWVATEFCETAGADGIYRKYSAICLGDEIIPRHLLFGRAWMLKEPEITTTPAVEEEHAFLETNPHRELLQRVFSLGGVRYGRVDYGVLPDGRPQIWEINTNPIIQRPVHLLPGPRLANQLWFARHFAEALRRHDPGGAPPRSWALTAAARQTRFALGRAWAHLSSRRAAA